MCACNLWARQWHWGFWPWLLQAHQAYSPTLSCNTHTCQLAVVQILNRVGLAKAGNTDLYTGGIGYSPRAAVVDNPGGSGTVSGAATKE